MARGVIATSIDFAVSAPPAFSISFSSEAIFAFKLRLSFFKEAKLAFCFSKLVPPPQAMANKIKVLVKTVEIFFIIVILIFLLDLEFYNFPVAFNKSTFEIKAVYSAFM